MLCDKEGELSAFQHMIAQKILLDFSLEHKMQDTDWLRYIEGLVASSEILIKKASSDGVFVDNYLSAKFLNQEHVFVIGLTENQLNKRKSSIVSQSDVFKIHNDLGVIINLPEHSVENFEIDWMLTDSSKHYVITRSLYNYDNEPLMPNLLWIQRNFEEDSLQLFGPTVWSSKQDNFLPEENAYKYLEINPKEITLSATQLENLSLIHI